MHWSRKQIAVRAGVAAALAVAAGAVFALGRESSPFPSQPDDSPTVRIGNPIPVASFALRDAYLNNNNRFVVLAYEGLTLNDRSGRELPALAERWEALDGAHRWRFHLRSGVVFHDGTPFSAADVRRSWETALRVGPGHYSYPYMLEPIRGARAFAAGEARSIEGVRIVDDSTIDVLLDRPLVFLPALLSLPQAAIAGARSTDRRPIGTGPWRWVSGQPRTGDEIWLARFRRYWGAQPKLDSVVIRTVPDSLQLAAFQAGWIDFTNLVVPGARAALRRSERMGYLDGVTTGLFRLTIDFRQPHLADPRVREALCLAVNVEKLSVIFGGAIGRQARGPVPPQMGGSRGPAACAFDPARARTLLQEAGWPAGRPLRFWAPAGEQGEFPPELGRLIANSLSSVGFDVEYHQDPGAWDAMAAKQADVVLESWYPDYADPDAFLFPLFHSSNAGSASNPGWFRDAVTDSLIDASRAALDSTERVRLQREAEARIVSLRPNVFLWFSHMPTAYAVRLKGWQPTTYTFRYQELELAARKR